MTPQLGQDVGDRGHIFVSYSRRDLEWVRQLVTDLEAAGLPVWLDVHKLKPGVVWDNEIERALRSTDVLLVVLSENSATSTNVLDEISFVLSRNSLVVPVLHRSCEIPYRLARLQNIDFTGPREVALQSLIERLHAAMAQAGSTPFAAAAAPTAPPAAHAEVRTVSTPSAAVPVWRRPAVAGAAVGACALVVAGFWLLRGSNNSAVAQPTAPSTAAIQAPAKIDAVAPASGEPPRVAAAAPVASKPSSTADKGGARSAPLAGPTVSPARPAERPGDSMVKPAATLAPPRVAPPAEAPAAVTAAGAAPPASEPSPKSLPAPVAPAAPAVSNPVAVRAAEPAPPPRPAPTARDEEAQIRKVIALYERALNEKSVSLLAQARPSLPSSDVQAILKGMEGAHTMSFGDVAVKVAETEASARLTRRDVVPGHPNLQIALTMTLLKHGENWVIERIERTQ